MESISQNKNAGSSTQCFLIKVSAIFFVVQAVVMFVLAYVISESSIIRFAIVIDAIFCILGEAVLIYVVTRRSRQNITKYKQVKAALYGSESKMQSLVGNMNDGLLQTDNDGMIEFVNERFCEMLGYEREELLGKITYDILYDDEARKFVIETNRQRLQGINRQYELRLRKKSGESVYVIVGSDLMFDGENKISGTMNVFTDISERKYAEEQRLHEAFHDDLTGLANRTLFMNRLRLTIEHGKSHPHRQYAVLLLDFDRFKIVNDSLGHSEGDDLLKQFARRLESCIRVDDLAAHLSGDEFAVLLSDIDGKEDAVRIAGRIQDNLRNSFIIAGREVFLTASAGIAFSTEGYSCAEDILRDADIAMYRAKAKGKSQYQIFDPAMHEQASKHLQFETEMRQAVERGEFQLYYQPIVELNTKNLIGFEALVRWNHPTRGIVPPLEFISAAEENNLIIPLGKWILQESCRQLRQWQIVNPANLHLTISVNISCKQFLQFDLAEQIAETLETTGLDPRCLKIEITESHIMENSDEAIIILNRLCSLGVELSLDDFGTGYSSLSYLHRLPVHYLKVDRSFVSRMYGKDENSEIVDTIIKLAQSLKMQVIAEGIETAEQLFRLRELQCEFGQGYYFSKPLEAKKAEELIIENALSPKFLTEMPITDLENNIQ